MDLIFDYDGIAITLSAEQAPAGWRVHVPGGSTYGIALEPLADPLREMTVMVVSESSEAAVERRLRLPLIRHGDSIAISWRGQVYRFTRGQARPAPEAASGSATAPTGGVVADLLVARGDAVEPFQPIAVIEAMKVMTTVESPRRGTVAEFFVSRGQRVEQGSVVARIDAATADQPGSEIES